MRNYWLGIFCIWAGSAAHAYSLEEPCLQLHEGRSHAHNLAAIHTCMQYFTNRPDFVEGVGSYVRAIELGERGLEVNPHSLDFYRELSWLYYNQWANWKHYHDSIPEMPGANYDQKLLALLQHGELSFTRNAAFQEVAAQALWSLAFYYRREHIPYVLEKLRLADELSTEAKTKVRLRLDLAHAYYVLGNRDDAIATYRRVLELEPEQKIALRYLNIFIVQK